MKKDRRAERRGPKRLAPAEAARRLTEDPNSVFWRLPDFLNQFGYGWHEILPELQSGRLLSAAAVVGRKPREVAVDDVVITAGAIMMWISRPDTPSSFRDRFLKRGMPN
jgi:hypothetical protein